MTKNTGLKQVSRYRGRRHRAYKFEVRSGFVTLPQVHDALCDSSTVEEHLFVDHRRDDAERHVQGYLRTTRGSKLTEREAVARIAAAGIPPQLIRVQPLVGRNAVEAFAHYLTHADEMLKARYERDEFFACNPESIWARVDAWLVRKARADEASDTEALIDRLRQQLMDGEIALYDIQLDYPMLWAAYRGRFNGIENLRENARKERARAEELREYLRQEQVRRAPADEPTALVVPVDDGAREQRDRERREAEDRALAESAGRFEKQRREDEQCERELDAQQAETDRRFDRARELRRLMDAREVELRKQADHDGLDAEALEDLLFEDETLNRYETELRALVPM